LHLRQGLLELRDTRVFQQLIRACRYGRCVQLQALAVNASFQQTAKRGACIGGVRAIRFAQQYQAHFIAAHGRDMKSFEAIEKHFKFQ
jgi:hypothetical protein